MKPGDPRALQGVKGRLHTVWGAQPLPAGGSLAPTFTKYILSTYRVLNRWLRAVCPTVQYVHHGANLSQPPPARKGQGDEAP